MSEIMVKESSEEPEFGELAQLVERCDRTAEVRGSSPLFSIGNWIRIRTGRLPCSRRVECRRRVEPRTLESGSLEPGKPRPWHGFDDEPKFAAGLMDWTAAAEAKLKEVPFFVRPAVRRKIEAMAAESQRTSIDLDFYDQAKAKFG